MSSDSELREAILEAAAAREDGRLCLPCGRAFEIAARAGVEVPEVGRVCDGEKVKIVQCQLGCFP